MFLFLIFVLSTVFNVSVAIAQSRGPAAPPLAVESRSVAVHPAARPVAVQPVFGQGGSSAHRMPSTQNAAFSTSTGSRAPRVIVLSQGFASGFDDGFSGFSVPGQGFDFAHLAAINSGAGVRALIDPVTQHQLALLRDIRRESPPAIGFLPNFFPGIYPSFEQSAAEASQPTIIVVPQAAPVADQYPDRGRAPSVETPVVAQPVEPSHDAVDFVLVRRDGGLLFAVAFTQGGGRITYITRDGVRRGLVIADLDIAATVSMNEERGTPLQFPEAFSR
ncbi:MAG: hypothetical protein GZ088_07685 [Acidipila sp.]|nr:hypothetical protein [Acidipila sp.]